MSEAIGLHLQSQKKTQKFCVCGHTFERGLPEWERAQGISIPSPAQNRDSLRPSQVDKSYTLLDHDFLR